MLRITINEVLKNRGRTVYWLAKNTELNYAHLLKICDNKTSMISFEYIEKICNGLNCTPNDIMKIIK